MKYANDNPKKVEIVKDYKGMYANSHPYKVVVTAGDNVATQDWVNQRIQGIARIVTSLPKTGEAGVTYFILKEKTAEGNIFAEWMYLTLEDGTQKWEQIGVSDAIDIEIDDALSTTSENPVQNKVITATLGDIETVLHAINNGGES